MRGHRTRSGIEGGKTPAAVQLCFLAAGVAASMSGCGAAAVGSPSQAVQVIPAAPSPDPVAAPATSETSAVESLAAKVADALDSLASGTPKPDAEELIAAFVSAGAQPDSVEVSIDTTPTGLEVDAMTGAVPIGDTCVFGHVRDGAATVTQLPALADGRCFVGDQR